MSDEQLAGIEDTLQTLVTGLGRVEAGLDQTVNRLGKVETGLDQTVNRLGKVETGLDQTVNQLGRVEAGLDQTVDRLGRVDAGVDQTATRLGSIEKHLEQTATKDDVKDLPKPHARAARGGAIGHQGSRRAWFTDAPRDATGIRRTERAPGPSAGIRWSSPSGITRLS